MILESHLSTIIKNNNFKFGTCTEILFKVEIIVFFPPSYLGLHCDVKSKYRLEVN